MTATKSVQKQEARDVEFTQDRPVLEPVTDIYEKEDAILVRSDMPGVDEKSLEITLEDDVLTLSGTQSDDTPEGYEPLLREYVTGVYHRSFTVPQGIHHAKIKARFHNGVLDVELPKPDEARPKRIAVETGK